MSQSRFNILYDDNVEKHIMAKVYQKQIRLREVFKDYDPLRKGLVTEDKFRSALVILGIHLLEKDIQKLLTKYKSNLPGLFNYDKFCSFIDTQFFDAKTGKQNMLAIESRSEFTPEETALLNQYLTQIKVIIRNKRILLKPVFQDFDKTKNQHVTYEQFKRVLSQLRIVSNATVLELIARKYMDLANDKDINYLKFCHDADDVKEMTEALAKENPQEFHYYSQDVFKNTKDLNLGEYLYTSKHLDFGTADTEKRIKAEVVMKHIRMKEYFKDFDKLRKGVISKHQFRRVMDQMCLKLTEAEFTTLCEKYRDPTDRFRWMDFCNNINTIFTQQGLEKNPQATVAPVERDTTLPARRKPLDKQSHEEARIQELIRLYQGHIISNRCHVKPHFKDFDKTYTGYVTKNQFLRILAAFNLFPSESDANILLKHYMNKGNLNEVNYYDFCRDIEAAINEDGVTFSEDYAKLFNDPNNRLTYKKKSYISNADPASLGELLIRLQRIVNDMRIRISEFLKDFDKLRSGTITVNQLRLGFNMAKIQLSDKEYNLLVSNYSCPDKKGYIFWTKICDEIDQVHTTKGLEMNPEFKARKINLAYSLSREKMTAQETQIAERMKQRFRTYSKGTRLDVKQFFKDWDRLGTDQVTRNKVSPKQFRQVLATVKFNITDDEFSAITKMYGTESGEINYVKFIKDVEPHFFSEFENIPDDPYAGKWGGPHNKGLEQIELLLDKIRLEVKINRNRLKEYFQDFDPLRKGKVQYNKFRGVLSKMNLNLTEEEMQLLEKRYLRQDGTGTALDYTKFVSDIDIVFTKPNLQKNPLDLPTKFVAPEFIKSNVSMTPTEQEKLESILQLLGGCVYRRRIMLKPYFYDKDQCRSGKVSYTRFRSILDFLNLKLTEEQFQILTKRFSHQAIEFNYLTFCEVLAKYSDS